VHHYIQDISAFPHEKEVIIIDEIDFKVVDVLESMDEKGEEYYLIILKDI
jgi:hypothetical protein